jgi:hypothetical protein
MLSTDGNDTIDDIEIIQCPAQTSNADDIDEPPSDDGSSSDQCDRDAEGPEDPQKALGK